jgi:dTDP-glucose pyrophosphorylase
MLFEKPTKPPSNYVITGLYFLDGTASEKAKEIKFSDRGELEITSLLEKFILEKKIKLKKLDRGYTWLDTGTYSSLLDAGNFVKTIIERQGLQIGCPFEIAFNNQWITKDDILKIYKKYNKTMYGDYLLKLIKKNI